MNLRKFTLQEKIGQMLCFAFHGTEYNTQLKVQIEEFKLGGVIHFARNILNPLQVFKLNQEIQKVASIPMFIGLDQEGGSVLRVMSGITPLPGAMAMQAANADIYKMNYLVGQDLVKLGFNLNFAPVGDVNNNPFNPVINSRSYSDHPDVVAISATKAAMGFQDAKILPTMKHFPGHGNTAVDSHVGLPVVKSSKEEIEKMELIPFKYAIEHGLEGVMISHILYEAYDGVYPATLSYEIITKLLKQQLGFKGLIVTDSLTMGAINSHYSKEEIVLNAVNAGNDILIFCGRADLDEQREIVHTFIQLVQNGNIPMSRIDESVEKILKYKEKYAGSLLSTLKDIGNINDVDYAKKIQEDSVTLVKGNGMIPLLKEEKTLLLFPLIKVVSLVDNEEHTYRTLNEFLGVDEIVFDNEFVDFDRLKEKAKAYDKIILATYNVMKDDYQTKVFDCLDKQKTLVIALRSPYDMIHLKGIEHYMCIYEATPLSFESCANVLKDETKIKGKLPVKLI